MLQRQYQRFDSKLRSLGRSIERVSDNDVAQKIMKLDEIPTMNVRRSFSKVSNIPMIKNEANESNLPWDVTNKLKSKLKNDFYNGKIAQDIQYENISTLDKPSKTKIKPYNTIKLIPGTVFEAEKLKSGKNFKESSKDTADRHQNPCQSDNEVKVLNNPRYRSLIYLSYQSNLTHICRPDFLNKIVKTVKVSDEVKPKAGRKIIRKKIKKVKKRQLSKS